jgi:hypothetical protein
MYQRLNVWIFTDKLSTPCSVALNVNWLGVINWKWGGKKWLSACLWYYPSTYLKTEENHEKSQVAVADLLLLLLLLLLLFFLRRIRPADISLIQELMTQLRILYTVGRTPWMGDQPVVRPLPIQENVNTEKSRNISMPWMGFEPMTHEYFVE